MPKLRLLTPPSPTATIDRPPTILEPTDDGDIEALAQILAAIAIDIVMERANASSHLPAGEQQAAGKRRVA